MGEEGMMERGGRNKWALGLGVSLVLNLGLAGMLWLEMRPAVMTPVAFPSPETVIAEMAARLDAADRSIFEEAVARREQEIRSRFQGLSANMNTFKEEFLRQPFDGPRFQDGKAKLDDARAAYEAVVMATVVESLSQMSPAGREWLSRMPWLP
jgi:hypothetical protein